MLSTRFEQTIKAPYQNQGLKRGNIVAQGENGQIHRTMQEKVLMVQSGKGGTIVEPLNTEEVRLLALSVHVVRYIAEQHGGSLNRINGEKKIQIYVPRDNREACAAQIAEQLSHIRKQLLYPLVALSCGKIIVPLHSN